MTLLADAIHNWDPVIVQLGDKLALRWYGLAYVGGFVAAFFLLRGFARRGLWLVPEEKVSDVVTYTAFFGILLGGRLGYVLFYMIPEHGWSYVLNDPMVVLRVWEGGMASHGAVLGIFFFTLVYARLNGWSWRGLGDGLVVSAPLGIIFGRFANFINGELYGRPTEGWWGMKFPKALMENGQMSDALAAAASVNEQAAVLLEERGLSGSTLDGVLAIAREDEQVGQALAPFLQDRHASQLYEGFLEGVVLFAILYFVRVKFPKLAHGTLTGLFFLFYAIFRIIVESVRQPDASVMFAESWAEMTKGQFYSLFMILIGVIFLATAGKFTWKKKV
ncbi:MAG: prolipoprotein diacylglyceryl transferase [Verrucomicrobiales bacterium]